MKRNTVVRPRLRGRVTRPRVADRREQTLESLLAVAGRLMAERGVAAVSVEQILLAAGISRGTFYSFVANKSELVAALIRPALTEGTERLERLRQGPAAAVLPGVVDLYTDLWERHRHALLTIPGVDAASFARVQTDHDAFIGAIERALERAADAGRLRNGSARYSLRVLTRTAVPLLRIYHDHPDGKRLYRESMLALLGAVR